MDLNSRALSSIFNALFRDTPLGHVHCAQPNSQIAKLAEYLGNLAIWPHFLCCLASHFTFIFRCCHSAQISLLCSGKNQFFFLS